jgi:hypothetical protein
MIPVEETNWGCDTGDPYPSPATQIQISYHVGAGPEDDSTLLGPGSGVLLVNFDGAAHLFVKARWCGPSDEPLSEYSDVEDIEPGGG